MKTQSYYGKSVFAFIWLCTCLLIRITPSMATETAPSLPQLNLAYAVNDNPLIYQGDKGEAAGMAAEMWEHLLRQAGYSSAWFDSASAEVGQADLVLSPVKLPEGFIKVPVPVDLQVFLYRRQSVDAKRLSPFRIGIVDGSPASRFIPASLLPNLVEYPNREEMLTQAATGALSVFVDTAGSHHYWKSSGLDYDSWQSESLGRSSLYVGINPAGKISAETVESVMAELDPGYVEELKRRYFGPEAGESGLVIAAQVGISPYADIGSDGQLHGLYVDIWRAWSEETGVPVRFLPSDMQQSVKDVFLGLADVQIGYPQSDSEKQPLLQTAWQIYGVKSRIYVPQEHEFNPTGAGEIIGVFKTAPYKAELQQELPDAEITVYDTPRAMLDALETGRISAIVAASRWTESKMVSNGSWDRYRVVPGFEYATRIEALVLPSRPALKKLIAEGFAAIPGDTLAKIESKWIYGPRDKYYAQQTSQIALSAAERSYLDELGYLTVGYLADWPPFEFSQGARMSGINAEVIELIAARLGIPLQTRAYDSFYQLQQALRSGEVQLIGSLQPSADRLTDISFTDSYWPSPWAIASLDDSRIFSLSQLAGKKLMVVQGYHLATELMLMRPKIELAMVADVTEGLARLDTGEADLLIGKLAVLAWEIQQQGYDFNLSMLTDVAAERSHIGVNNQYQTLVPLINRALQHIDDHEMRAIYDHWVPAKLNDNELSLFNGSYSIWWLIAGMILLLILVGVGYRTLPRKQSVDFLQPDPATGLIGRDLLDDRLSQAVLLHHRQQARFALFFISIEGMDVIATTAGQDAADAALARMVGRLAAGIRRSDTLARFSHQELVAILPFVSNEEHLGQLARNIQSLLTEGDPEIESSLLKVGIGIAMYPKDGVDPIGLMAEAAKLTERALETGVGIQVA